MSVSFPPLFPEIADQVFLRLPRALTHWVILPANAVALPEPWLAGLYASRSFSPLVVSPRPFILESLFLGELGPVGFYYSLAYRLFDLVSEFVFLCLWCQLSLGDVFLLGAFVGVFGSWLSGPFSHLLVVFTHSTEWRFLCQAGSVGFNLGIAGWTVVGGFGLHGPRLVEGPFYLTSWYVHICACWP